MSKPTVIVTGFGPFDVLPVNASWEAVKAMNKKEIEEKHNIEMVVMEIPVAYESVDNTVPQLWDKYNPKLIIHTGVSNIAQELNVELGAHKTGYKHLDIFGKRPEHCACPADGPDHILTKFDVERIKREFNEYFKLEKIKAVIHPDAGDYLCGYILYTSLSRDSSRALFAHVPDTGTYSAEESARGLQKILELCLAQLEQ